MIDSETDEMCPPSSNTKESKSTETFMMREYTPAGLIDIVVKLQQKTRESIQPWLMGLWDL